MGEPFCTILPYPKAGLDGVTVEVTQSDGSLDDYERALEGLAESQALQSVFARLSAGDTAGDVTARTAKSLWAACLAAPPAVTCICPTEGRVELLEEAIHSFLRQDYPGPKQLIVLNDTEGQTLAYDHPEVHVINVPRRFHSNAEKHKAAVGLASHDLIFPWPEDDISLPHRLSFTVAHLAEPAVFWKADKAWLWNGEELSGPETEALHEGSCFRRETFVKHHGYSHTETDYAGAFEALCASEGPGAVHLQAVEPAEVYSIRRGEPLNDHEPSRGRIQLRPRWEKDYGALVREHLGIPVAEPPAQPAPKTEDIPFPPPFYVIPPPPPVEQPESLFRGDYPLKISVILPATNESVLLQRTVEQFVATLPANSEVIVIDNGSTDGCADFLAEGTWENVRLLRSIEPLGVSAARNRGLAEARGEVVVFSDAHMDLPERWWQPLVRTLNLPNVGLAAPGIGVMGKPDRPAACGQRIAETNLRVEWLPRKSAEPGPVPTLGGGFMAMRHETLKQAGTFDEGMPQWGSEDLEICVRYWLLGYEVWVVPEVTVLHYFRNARPYGIQWHLLTHNLLRVALLHFGERRLARVASALRNRTRFGAALAQAVESDVWQKRAEFAARRVRDDDWLFEKFKDQLPRLEERRMPLSPHEPPAEMAYLIVAHHQPEHLARLIRAMDQENNCFFIHIDQGVAIEPFEAAVPRQANIIFLHDRVPVRWGELSVVLAVLKLLRAAVASNLDFKYYTLLSGSDYPIKDRREIHARLRASSRQFIRIDRKLVGEPRNAHFRFIERLPQGTYYGDLIPYHGSMYWSLTADCVHFILAFLNENPGFIDLHEYVFAPDEIFFHSIVKASPFAKEIVHDFERGTCADDLHHANHYIDWAGRRQRENLTLDERDFQDLLASEVLFARKFHRERSRRLLDLIDYYVHHSSGGKQAATP